MVIDADKIGHSVLLDKEVCSKIVETFGHGILNEDGTINRKKLGEVVFSSPADLQFLNSITHPVIEDRIMESLKEWETSVDVAVIDAALLIEAGMTKLVDKIILVVASREVQLKRIIERDGLTFEEASKRIHAQLPIEKRLPFADYVIENNSFCIKELEEKVKVLWQSLSGLRGPSSLL